MKKVYDRFADEYIDESEKNPYAPPERYTEITEEVLVENAARWFLTALKRLLDEETGRKTEPTISKMEQVEPQTEEMVSCQTCRHWIPYECTNDKCHYEPKTEQTERSSE